MDSWQYLVAADLQLVWTSLKLELYGLLKGPFSLETELQLSKRQNVAFLQMPISSHFPQSNWLFQ